MAPVAVVNLLLRLEMMMSSLDVGGGGGTVHVIIVVMFIVMMQGEGPSSSPFSRT